MRNRKISITGQLVSSFIALVLIWFFPMEMKARLLFTGLILLGLIVKVLIIKRN